MAAQQTSHRIKSKQMTSNDGRGEEWSSFEHSAVDINIHSDITVFALWQVV